jgi:Bacterial archaeo-eukaryotic release factor family 11
MLLNERRHRGRIVVQAHYEEPMLHIDIPTLPEFKLLAAIKGDICVSLYVPTLPLRERERQNRIALKDLAARALAQLREAGVDPRRMAPLEERFRHLARDDQDHTDDDKIRKLQNKKPDPIDDFWKYQGHGLAVLATPQMMRTFRLPYHPKPLAEVADRFHLTPLIRAMTSPQDVFVLALAEKGVRLLHVFVNLPPQKIHVPDLPENAEQVARRASIRERNQKGHLQGSEAAKFLLHKFARQVDHALHNTLAARSAPLVLAADEPLASIYRSANTYPALLDETIPGNPDLMSDAQLGDAVLPILDRLYERELRRALARYAELKPLRATTDVSYAAHAATAGAIEELLVDLDAVIPGIVSEVDGSVTYASSDNAEVYSVVDEIARRALYTGARVLAARRENLPQRAAIVAILRYQFG